MHRHLRIHEKELEASGTPLSKELHTVSKGKGRRKLTDSEGYGKMEEYSSAKRKLDNKEEGSSPAKWSRIAMKLHSQQNGSSENGSEVRSV